MSERPLCATGCLKPSPDGFICHPCGYKLRGILDSHRDSITKLIPELVTTIRKHDRIERSTKPRALDPDEWEDLHDSRALVPTASPFNVEAAALLHETRNVITTWVRHLCESRGIDMLPPEPSCPCYRCYRRWMILRCKPISLRELLAWLTKNIASIRMDEAAGEFVKAMTQLRSKLANAVDRQRPDVYAGPCDAPDVKLNGEVITPGICGVDLFAHLGADTVTCEACGAEYDVQARRDFMRDQARAIWATATVVANGLTGLLEVEVTPSMVRNMGARREVAVRDIEGLAIEKCVEDGCTHRDCDEAKQKFYLVGDVMDVVIRRVERAAAKANRPNRRAGSCAPVSLDA